MGSSRPIIDSLLCFASGFLVCDYFVLRYIMNYCRVKQRGFCEIRAKLSCKTS